MNALESGDSMRVAAVIPTHNPRPEIIDRVVQALKVQTLDPTQWDLLVVDNASSTPLKTALVSWHPNGQIVREDELGLTRARVRAIAEVTADVVVWVDDDNILSPAYLSDVVRLFSEYPRLGAAGGKSLPEYVTPPPEWHSIDLAPLGCRDLGDDIILVDWNSGATRHYPHAAPIGAGMAVRMVAMKEWSDAVAKEPSRLSLGRRGAALTSGEDNDINLTLLERGYQLAYFPQLCLTHVIPPTRVTRDYLQRISRTSFRDFVRVLDSHGIRPWTSIPSWTVPLRSLRAWVRHRAWRGPVEAIHWHSAVGQFEGRASLRS